METLAEKRYYNDRIASFCNINEGLIRSYDVDTVENYLKSKFNNIKVVLNRSENYYRMFAYHRIPEYRGNFEVQLYSLENIPEICKCVENLYGWFCSYDVLNGDILFVDWDRNYQFIKLNEPHQDIDIYTYARRYLNGAIGSISMFFEAKFAVEEHNIGNLYHITSLKNVQKIKTKGLVPKTQGNFPDRVYFGNNLDAIFRMLKGRYTHPVILKLNVDEYGDDIRNKYIFYKDPREDGAVFTLDNIDPKYLQICTRNSNGELCCKSLL